MGDYGILQCVNCHTATTDCVPDDETLRRFYDGFLFEAHLSTLKLYLVDEIRDWLWSFRLPEGSRMLDIGGGGGFMAHAFEHFGCGQATYVDLDSKACEFASHELGLKHVFNEDVCALSDKIRDKFHFIYSRHVIEHVSQPTQMLEQMIHLLAEGGVIEMILPNGISLEYLGYPSLLKNRAKKILASNNEWTSARVWRNLFSYRIAHGIDPVRHLWAISPKGIKEWLSHQQGIQFQIMTAPLSDPTYSFYFSRKLTEKFSAKMWSCFVNSTLGRLRGNCHLIVRIVKTQA